MAEALQSGFAVLAIAVALLFAVVVTAAGVFFTGLLWILTLRFGRDK